MRATSDLSLLEQAPFGVHVFAPDGRSLRVNRAFEELWGVNADQVAGYNILEDEQLERNGSLEYIRRGFEGHTTRIPPILYDLKLSIPGLSTAKQTHRWVGAVIFPVRDERGAIQEVVVINEDLTATMIAQQQKDSSERKLRDVLESIGDAFYGVSSDWRFIYVNPQAEQQLGRAPGELLGKVVWEELPGLVGSGFETVFRRVASERISLSITDYYPDHDRWYEVHTYPGADGGISVYARNVTEAKLAEAELARVAEATRKAEEAVREGMRLYQAIGESIDYGVWVADPKGNCTYASDAFLKLVGMSQQECAGFGWSSAVHPEDLDRSLRHWRECVRTGIQCDVEYRVRGVDGSWHPVLARGVPVRNDSGEISGWAGINLDISRMKQVETELREADRRKDEFLATLAHELRNPLAPLRNSLEILKLPHIDEATAEQAHETMERQVHHLVRLVDDLLDVSRVMRGKIDLRRERVELSSLVARAIETCQPLMNVHGHRLEISLPPESLLLDADPVRLSQVLGNLLVNAAKYTYPGGTIRVSARRAGSDVEISVRDNGIGISSELLPRVFDLFVQGDHKGSHSQGGLGVGLTLVSRLVEMHQGSVRASSEGIGKGSEFLVTLPLARGAEAHARTRSNGNSSSAKRAPSGLRLMVVDDNEDAAISLAMLLRLRGHDVRVAHDGPSCLALAESFRPNLVFLDIGMPGMDGLEVARRFRSNKALRHMVLTALTGWGQQEDRRRTAEAGFDHHLVKPPDIETLDSMLAALRENVAHAT